MTPPSKPAPLIGGPLNGQTYKPKTKRPHYVSASGSLLTAKQGDRIMAGRSKIRACYVLQADDSYAWREVS